MAAAQALDAKVVLPGITASVGVLLGTRLLDLQTVAVFSAGVAAGLAIYHLRWGAAQAGSRESKALEVPEAAGQPSTPSLRQTAGSTAEPRSCDTPAPSTVNPEDVSLPEGRPSFVDQLPCMPSRAPAGAPGARRMPGGLPNRIAIPMEGGCFAAFSTLFTPPRQRSVGDAPQEQSGPRSLASSFRDMVAAKVLKSTPEKEGEPSPMSLRRSMSSLSKLLGWLEVNERNLACTGDADWLSQLFVFLWPRVGPWLDAKLLNMLEPAINNALPGILKGHAKFTQLSLGATPPTFGPMEVFQTEDLQEFELRIGIQLITDSRAWLDARGVQIGIEKIKIEGTLSIVFRPPKKTPPFFGGVELYMINAPVVDLEFHGAGRIAEFPTIRPLIRNVIANQLANRLVLPNRMAWDLEPEDDTDLAELKCPDPHYILRLTVLRGKNLEAADYYLTQAPSSDPYVVVSLGATRQTSPVVMNNLNPWWNYSANYPVHDSNQLASFMVYDQDKHTADDLIGTSKDMKLEDLMIPRGSQSREMEIKLKNSKGTGKAGSLWVTPEWMRFNSNGTAPICYLAVKMHEGRGVKACEFFPYRVEVAIAEQTGTTRFSYANGSRGMNEEMQVLCVKLLTSMERGAVAELLGFEEEDVVNMLATHDPQDCKLKDAVNDAMQRKQACNPQWEEVVQMLLDREVVMHAATEVELRFRNKKQEVMGTVRIPMQRLREAEDCNLDGPFPLEGMPGAELRGSIKLKFLADC